MKKEMNISIDMDGIWSGDGVLSENGVIEDCPAVLISDDHSDSAYSAIEDAISRGDDSVEVDGHTFTWDISECD